MNTLKNLALAASLTFAGLAANTTCAQSTDGFHTIQVFPVVVDSGSFAQRFTFRNKNSSDVTINMRYYPGAGTAQATPINCGNHVVTAGDDRTFSSLHSICSGLPLGSHFGFLYTYEVNNENLPYAAYSRISNPQGQGFSVEAFPAHTFSSATTTVSGLRRLAASGAVPAFQTNCFAANLNEITAGAGTVTEVDIALYTASGTQIGGTTTLQLAPGKITRMLDIFEFVGTAPGNYDNVRARFSEFGDDEPGLMTFCTVQDNTSFGADFRIGKQEVLQDDHVKRLSTTSADVAMSSLASRTFSIPASNFHHNTHVIYFRHPDWVQCEIINPSTGLRAAASYGLEMRLLASNGTTVVAGGQLVTGFGETYLGDKTERNDGANDRYTIEVENSLGPGLSGVRPYRLRCQSGSGHTYPDTIRVNAALEQF